ncbi:MAG: hypothetical protein CVU90_08875 [Firmicutes bacterium HGW-Firmicutes-15]|nr:MAG: hypothetical protein CVU90_08875 [Firmicutes bacterium HGW-Firmicutes-15]
MKPERNIFEVSHASDISAARRMAREIACAIGFNPEVSEEIVLVVSELASNLHKHAKIGTLIFTSISDGERIGLKIESNDNGPGIADIEQAITDGFSTAGSLGFGLGTVNRIMDEFNIISVQGLRKGTQIVCKKWLKNNVQSAEQCPLEVGVATRAHPLMVVNGDDYVIKQWGENLLVAVIDGLGHGPLAHKAAHTARQYIENHFDQPVSAIFNGVGRACRGTRGVVMALAKFEWGLEKLSFASIGNIETRVFENQEKLNIIVRRGVIGFNAPNPLVIQNSWNPKNIMVMHSDGMKSHWKWDDFPDLKDKSAMFIAQSLLNNLDREDDDATVVVVKSSEDVSR